jgi:hypothetical protein
MTRCVRLHQIGAIEVAAPAFVQPAASCRLRRHKPVHLSSRLPGAPSRSIEMKREIQQVLAANALVWPRSSRG